MGLGGLLTDPLPADLRCSRAVFGGGLIAAGVGGSMGAGYAGGWHALATEGNVAAPGTADAYDLPIGIGRSPWFGGPRWVGLVIPLVIPPAVTRQHRNVLAGRPR
jgi:hypothetical protein